MSKQLAPSQEYIKSGEYFVDARQWYIHKYTYPITQRSINCVLAFAIFLLLICIIYNIYNIFPLKTPVRYTVLAESEQTTSSIIPADQIPNNSLGSIADIMVKNYVNTREKYDVLSLKNQFQFIKNTSTRMVFKDFYNFMNIDNPLSPMMRYQKYVKRTIKIISSTYPQKDAAVVRFIASAKDSMGEVFENSEWQATLNFQIDRIDVSLPPDTKFNFFVTSYKLKLLKS